jgi:hypothetical protein
MASGGGSANSGSSTLVLAWDVPPDQEEPWRRLLQELSGSRYEQYAQSRRRLGILSESVWLVPKPFEGGVAIICLETLDPERVLHELGASNGPFDFWYSAAMRKLFGFDLSRVAGAESGELLFAWRDGGPNNLPQSKSGNESR